MVNLLALRRLMVGDVSAEYRDLFNSFDRQHTGSVNIADLLAVSQQLGLPGDRADLDKLLSQSNVNGTQLLDRPDVVSNNYIQCTLRVKFITHSRCVAALRANQVVDPLTFIRQLLSFYRTTAFIHEFSARY